MDQKEAFRLFMNGELQVQRGLSGEWSAVQNFPSETQLRNFNYRAAPHATLSPADRVTSVLEAQRLFDEGMLEYYSPSNKQWIKASGVPPAFELKRVPYRATPSELMDKVFPAAGPKDWHPSPRQMELLASELSPADLLAMNHESVPADHLLPSQAGIEETQVPEGDTPLDADYDYLERGQLRKAFVAIGETKPAPTTSADRDMQDRDRDGYFKHIHKPVDPKPVPVPKRERHWTEVNSTTDYKPKPMGEWG